MASHSLYVIPGVGRDAALAKKAALEGPEDAGLAPLEATRVQQLAEAITRAHPELGSIRGVETDVAEAFFELTWEGDLVGPDVFVSGSGVEVILQGEGNDDDHAREVERGLRVAKTATSLVPGSAVFDLAAERFVDPDDDRDAIHASARDSFARPHAGAGFTPPPAAVRAMRRILLLPMLGFVIAAFGHPFTKWALLALPLGLVAAVLLVRSTMRKAKDDASAPGGPPPSPPAGPGPANLGPGPINPG